MIDLQNSEGGTIKNVALIMIMTCAMLSVSTAQEKQRTLPAVRDIDQWTATEVETWMRSRRDRGSIFGDDIAAVSIYRSAIVVPPTEKKIEEVLRSTSPGLLH